MSTRNPAPTVETSTEGEATPRLQRRSRASAGGFGLKLDAPVRAGWTRRFVNTADPLRVAQMEELGYVPVAEKASEGNARTDGLGSRITRMAGKTEEGAPFQAILMETPNDLYEQGAVEKEAQRARFDEAINRGAFVEESPEAPYKPSRSSITHSS